MNLKIILISLALTLSALSLPAKDLMRSPLPAGQSPAGHASYQTSTLKLVLTGMINFYSKVISPADGPRSPSYPTGSAYGRQAIEKYGFFPGVFLIGDRLMHEADRPLGPTITVYGRQRYYDPVIFNTYWWDESVLP